MTHNDLVIIGKKWLIKARGCKVVLTEKKSQNGEIPDVIGWKGQISTLIECKVSLADFRRDLGKWFRNTGPGIGQNRFFLAPKGVIPVAELPDGWGLLEVDGNIVRTIKSHTLIYLNDKISSAEVPLLVAELRRAQLRNATNNKRRKRSSRQR